MSAIIFVNTSLKLTSFAKLKFPSCFSENRVSLNCHFFQLPVYSCLTLMQIISSGPLNLYV